MLLKRFGMVTVGVTAGLLAAAPLASASECAPSESHASDASGSCESNGGNNDSDTNGVVSVSALNGNNVLNCTSFLNDTLNGNLSGNTL